MLYLFMISRRKIAIGLTPQAIMKVGGGQSSEAMCQILVKPCFSYETSYLLKCYLHCF
jgi:hypothetical protein